VAADAQPVPARITNLSKGGCLIELQRPHSLEHNMTVELAFRVNLLPFRVRVLASWIKSDTVVGFQFATLTERAQRQLEELIEELSAVRRRHVVAYR
jgi:hypothetical protein